MNEREASVGAPETADRRPQPKLFNEFSPVFFRYLVAKEAVKAFLTYPNNSGFHKGRVVYLVHTVDLILDFSGILTL